MAWTTTAELDEFDEAAEDFRSRVAVTDAEYEALSRAERARAFHLASVNELAVVQLVFDELDLAITKGLPLEEFQARVAEKLTNAQRLGGYHLETVFRNATQSAYNAGRWHQMTDAEVSSSRPYWLFDAVLDDRTTEHICRPLDGTCKAHDDPFWLTHWPGLHHRCRSGIRSLRHSAAVRHGITVGDPPGVEVQGDFGLAPPLQRDFPMPDRSKVDNDVWTVFDQRRATDPDNINDDE